jgi:hypothetical protein
MQTKQLFVLLATALFASAAVVTEGLYYDTLINFKFT